MDLTNDSKGKKTNCECKAVKVQQGEKGPPSERCKGLVPAVPPVLKNVGKLAAGVAGMASGSATEKKVECQKYQMNHCKSAKTTCADKQKKKSACIDYGISKPNDPEDTEEKTSYRSSQYKGIFTEEKCRNQKVKFLEPINLYPKYWPTNETKSSATYPNTQIKCKKINYCANKSNQCSNLSSNIDCSRRRYNDLIKDEDIVYSCNLHNNNNVCIENGMSASRKCSAGVTSNYFDLFERTETSNQCKNLRKLEVGTSGIDNTKNEILFSNNVDLFSTSTNKNLLTSQMNKPEINSTKNAPLLSNNVDLFAAVKSSTNGNNTPNENLRTRNLLTSQLDKPEINSTKNAPLPSNTVDLFGTAISTTNENTPYDNLESKSLPTSQMNKSEIYSTKNAPLSSNTVDLFSAVKSTTYENTPYGNLKPKNLPTSQIDKPEINSTKNALLHSNNVDLFGAGKSSTNENSNRNTPNDNLESKNLPTSQIDKLEIHSTKNALLFSNHVDYFDESNNNFDEKEMYVHTITSAPTLSNNVDLFGIKNKHDDEFDVNVDKSKQQNPIDLFDKSNFAENISNENLIQDTISSTSFELEESATINTTKSAPLFFSDLNLLSTLNKVTSKNNNVNDENNTKLPFKFSYPVADFSNLPKLEEDTKYNTFFITKNRTGINHCECKILVENNSIDSSLNGKSCKVYRTMLGVDACSHSGNPRNKTALQPGHSLMDWIRLSHSGKDLTGVGPRAGTLSVSIKQLAEHNTENDAWIAIRGKVYNITEYFDFHPGGKEELMKGVGQDATQMFNAVHPWVNYESILQKCLVGRLTSVEVDEEMYSLFYGKSNQTIQVPRNFRIPSQKPATNSNGGPPIENISNPKFDWIQQLDYITTIFYTKPLSNAQVQVTAPTKENKLEIILTYSNYMFKNHLHFSNNIHWPCKVTINWDTGKIDVNFRKIVSKIWDNYGTLTQESEVVPEDNEYEKIKYVVLNSVQENYNTYLIAFQRIDGVKQTIPIGFHVKVYGTIEDQELIRCYTPVPCSFMRKYSNDYEAYRGDVCLLIKNYPEGLLSPTICNSVKGDVFEFSPPLGVFNMEKIASRSAYLFLAAGSGITPMLGIIKFILESTQLKCEKIYLLYFNRTEEDIILRKHFDSLVEIDKRVVVKYILSHQTENWAGLTGHIDENLLKTSIDELCTNTQLFPVDIFSLICGPLVFTNLAKSILIDIGYTDDSIHVFGS